MKIRPTYIFVLGVVLGVSVCQMVNSYRHKAVWRLQVLNDVVLIVDSHYEANDMFLSFSNAMLDGLVIETEKYSRFMTTNEKRQKQSLFKVVFQLRKLHPREMSNNEDFRVFQNQADDILESACFGNLSQFEIEGIKGQSLKNVPE